MTGEALRELRHDLRTPFNAILNFAEMLLEDGAGAATAPLEEIKSRSRELLSEIETALGPGRGADDELLVLGEAIAARLVVLQGHLTAALAAAGPASVDDLRRLGDAVDLLGRLASERLMSCPWPPPAAVALNEGPAKEPAAGQAMGGGKVLVVDDNPTNRDLLSRRLEREGCTPVEAAGGEEALALLTGGGIDVVLLDLRMPGMDGFEVLRRARADAAMRDVPVIVVSAVDDLASVVRCIEMGAADYLPKPFDPILLRARVGACLEQKRLRDKELEHLRGVEAVQAAAASVEAGTFDPAALRDVAARPDELGQLARVFMRMAGEVRAREDRLKAEIRTLRVEIDGKRAAEEVAAVTESEAFARLAGRAEALRARIKGTKPAS